MPYISAPHSLEFWSRAQERLDAAYRAQRQQLAELVHPIQATVDTGDLVLTRAAETRAEALAVYYELEALLALGLTLDSQRRHAEFLAGLPQLTAKLAYRRNIVELQQEALCGLPRRLPIEQELQAAITEYSGLRNAGNGELALNDRQRLRALRLNLPVLGAEDTVEFSSELRKGNAEVDQLATELQTKRVQTTMAFKVPDQLAALASTFGIALVEVQRAETSQGELPAQQPAEAGGAVRDNT